MTSSYLRIQFLKCLALGCVIYGMSWFLIHFALRDLILPLPLVPAGSNEFLLMTFAVYFIVGPIVYLSCCWIAKRWLAPEWQRLILYSGATFAVAIFFEIAVDTIFHFAIGRYSWVYTVGPIGGGRTSLIATSIWPVYGAYLYFFRVASEERGWISFENIFLKGLIVAISAMSLEIFTNFVCFFVAGNWMFFYLKEDLLHFTSWEIFGPYFIAGILGMALVKVLDRPVLKRHWIGFAGFGLGALELIALNYLS